MLLYCPGAGQRLRNTTFVCQRHKYRQAGKKTVLKTDDKRIPPLSRWWYPDPPGRVLARFADPASAPMLGSWNPRDIPGVSRVHPLPTLSAPAMIVETRHCITEILSRQPLFRVLNGSELTLLAPGTQEYRFSRNEMLFQKGDRGNGMYLVIAGQIKLFLTSPAGAEKIIQMAGAGDSFGEESAFTEQPVGVAAQASRDTLLLHVDKQTLVAAVGRSPILARALLTRLSNRMCQLIENMETCVQRSSSQRVAHFLSQMAPKGVECFDLELDANKQTIASQLNLAPETFSRVLGRFSRDGHIQVKGRCITVKNLGLLKEFAG